MFYLIVNKILGGSSVTCIERKIKEIIKSVIIENRTYKLMNSYISKVSIQSMQCC